MVQPSRRNRSNYLWYILGFGTKIHEDHIENEFHSTRQLDTPKNNPQWSIYIILDRLKGLIYLKSMNSNVLIFTGKQAGWLIHCPNIDTKLLVLKSTILFKSSLRRQMPIFNWTKWRCQALEGRKQKISKELLKHSTNF